MKYLKILFLIICCFLNVTICYAAASVSVDFKDPSAESDDESNDTDDWLNGGDLGDGYTCWYKINNKYNGSVVIDGFNKNNKSIINVKTTPLESIKAGTSIGISIVESKTAKIEYTFKVTKETTYCKVKKHKYICFYSYYPYVDDVIYDEGKAPTNCRYDGDAGCSETGTSTVTVTSGSKYTECETEAKNAAESAGKNKIKEPSFDSIKLLDPNDANSTKSVNITSKGCEGNCVGGTCSCVHTYTPKAVCINKLESTVEYKDGCGDDEFKVENETIDGVEHFHYFIPLNVVDGWYSLVFRENPNIMDKDWCEKAIDANPNNYADFFVGASLVEDGKKVPLPANNITLAKEAVENGCYIKTEIRIPVSEGIYDVNNEKIDGYNLFVRNSNENNPFPNPVTNKDSLWFNWYNENYSGGQYSFNKVSPNIKNSFSDTSYVVEKINARQVRTINKNHENYLKNNLLTNGHSEFINGSTNSINFVKTSSNYYKVGCGPLNVSSQAGCQ